jgi:hypothetical protein
MEYVEYLMDEKYIRGPGAVEALGWAQDRREELELRKEEEKLTTVSPKELKKNMLIEAVKELLLLLKIVLAMLFMVFAMVVILVLKK